MTELKCPICQRKFSDEDQKAALPFCSLRCKGIDASRWLGEEYGLPLEPEEEIAGFPGEN